MERAIASENLDCTVKPCYGRSASFILFSASLLNHEQKQGTESGNTNREMETSY